MRNRIAAIVALASVAVLAACTPSPGTTLEDGGTYVVEVSIPSQQVTNEFPLPFGLGSCVAAVNTPEVEIPGTTVEVPPFEYTVGSPTATIPEVSFELPRTRVSAGYFSLTCLGHELGRIGLSIEFDGVATIQSATLDIASHRVTLNDTTLQVNDAELTFPGAPAGTAPVQLDPFTLEIPPFQIWV
ncbi:MAG: hypothetical protein ACYC2O_01845 [Microthrixaceae bacterium]